MGAQEQRRLLELAAKAANVDFYTPEGMDTPWCKKGFYLRGCIVWNPIDDDGDALRLAIDLELDVSLGKSSAVIEFGRLQIEELDASDPYAAVRLAIVRAAAAIGEKMK